MSGKRHNEVSDDAGQSKPIAKPRTKTKVSSGAKNEELDAHDEEIVDLSASSSSSSLHQAPLTLQQIKGFQTTESSSSSVVKSSTKDLWRSAPPLELLVILF